MNPTQPVVGFRSWRTTEDGHLLTQQPHYNPGRDCTWWYEDRPAQAGVLPTEKNTSGLYAYAQIRPTGGSLVHGAIVAWGTVVLHDRGFRAEYARPVALLVDEDYTPNTDPGGYRAERIALVAERRSIPVLRVDELAAYASWHGDLMIHPLAADFFRDIRANAEARRA